MTRSTISRLVNVLEHWLPFWACLSGTVVPISPLIEYGAPSNDCACPGLEAQLREILDFIGALEKRSTNVSGSRSP
jgi:hypothetical protein